MAENENGCGCKGNQSEPAQNAQPKGEKGKTPSSTIIREPEPDSK